MRRPIFLLLPMIAAGFLAACQTTPATSPPATAAPQSASATPAPPTATAVIPATVTLPAATVTPTATPLPSETPAPAVTATPDPNLGVGATLYEDKFDGARWGWTYQDDAVNFSLGNGQLNAVMSRSDAFWRISSGPDFIRAGDQQVRLATRVNLCYDADEYGLLFRNTNSTSGDQTKFNGYLFKITCGGQARVELLRDSVPSVLLDWTRTPAIVAGAPAENALLVWAAGDQLHFYVNDKHVGSLTDRAFADGDVGVYLRDRTNGGLSVSFTGLTIKAVTLP
ncbi:MAG: hypothetical protein JNK29_09500 [Anaerolineales bacterium]|nr:hypothetical protein [Anaerolineales bacterium]